jgi:hypothetical protein
VIEVYRRFGGTYSFHLQGRRKNQAKSRHARSEVITAVAMKSTFLNMAPCNLLEYYVSEKRTASIFRVEEKPRASKKHIYYEEYSLLGSYTM